MDSASRKTSENQRENSRGYFDIYKREYPEKARPLERLMNIAHVEDLDNYTFLRQQQEEWTNRRENR